VADKLYEAFKYVIKYELKSSIRRYIVLGAFDGILLSLSILLSSVISHFPISDITVAVLSGTIATAVSSTWNALVVELGEKKAELERLEKQVLKSLRGTIYDYSGKISAVLSAISHGASPFLGLLILYAYQYSQNYLVSLILGLVLLGILGLLYGEKLRDKAMTMAQLIVAGLITSFLILFVVK